MDELKQAYARLYRTLDGCARYQDLFTLPIQRPVLTCFTAVEGGRYRSAPIRFLLVGRAVNGWDEQRDYGDRLTLENFVASSVNNLKGARMCSATGGTASSGWAMWSLAAGCLSTGTGPESIILSR